MSTKRSTTGNILSTFGSLVIGSQCLSEWLNTFSMTCSLTSWPHLSACYNPLIYIWMNGRFRDGFKYVFRCLPCVQRSQRPDFIPQLSTQTKGTIMVRLTRLHKNYDVHSRVHTRSVSVCKWSDISDKHCHSMLFDAIDWFQRSFAWMSPTLKCSIDCLQIPLMLSQLM